MKVKRLVIEEVPSWEAVNKGQITATVDYESKQGKLTVLLDSSVSVKLLEICASLIAEFSQKAATQIANDIIATIAESKHPQIELKKETNDDF